MKRPLLILLVVLLAGAAGCARAAGPQVAREGMRQQPALPEPRVHFPTAGAVVVARDRAKLSENARWLAAHPEAQVVLEGHCDERGSDRYNLELGDRRARGVKAMLLREGVDDEERMAIVSQGKRRPLDGRHTAAAWQGNRRVEFILK